MILATLAQSSRYTALHPLFPRAFDYLRNTDLSALPIGVHQIIDQQLFVIVEQVNGRPREQAQLEAHRQYIDLQLVLAGVDEMGWRALSTCQQPVCEHDLQRDIRFFADAPAAWVRVPAQHFCLFFPDDAHAPLVGEGEIHKVILKIALAATESA